MSAKVTIEPVDVVTDARGLVLEPVGPDVLPLQRNVHLVLTEPGHVRGNHFHERGTEVTVAFGPALFRYREGGEVRDVSIPDGTRYRIVIPPRIAHAIQNTGTKPMLLIGFNSEPHDRARPDVVRDVLIEPPSAPGVSP